MYREKVLQNLEKAVEAERKEGLGSRFACVLIGLVLFVNAFTLLGYEKGIYMRLMGPETTAIWCILFGGLLFFGGLSWLKAGLKARSKNAVEKFSEAYLKQVRKLGDENQVFALIEATPQVGEVLIEQIQTHASGLGISTQADDLRINNTLVAGTSEKGIEKNFVCPVTSVVRAGINQGVYIHYKQGGKKKVVMNVPAGVQGTVLDLLQQYSPKARIDRPKTANQ